MALTKNDNAVTLSRTALEYMAGLINKIVSAPKQLIDDVNLQTVTTFSSVRLNSLINETLQDAKDYTDEICGALVKLTCEKTTIQPTLDNSEKNVIYLYSADGNAPFEQYLKISDTELIDMGSTTISLNDYLTITDAVATYCKKTDFDGLNTEVTKVKNTLGTDSLNTTSQTVTGAINELKTNFEDGVNTIYDAVVAKGVTPTDKSPSNVAKAIESLILKESEPLLTYTFTTGYSVLPILNNNTSYKYTFEDTDNGDGTTTRKLYGGTPITQINFSSGTNKTYLISLDNTAPLDLTNMYSMFNGCSSLIYVNLNNIYTSKVTDMGFMFNRCESLTSLDLSKFRTDNVTNMNSMFNICSSLVSIIGLDKFNTSNVTNMGFMFGGCKKLNSLNLNSFDTSKVTKTDRMFQNCLSLTSITGLDKFDTNKVTNMSYMFNHCESLTSLNVSSFDTSNVTSMSCMFQTCSSLTSLDLSNFDTSNVTSIYNMFVLCTSLSTLRLDNFNSANITSSGNAFKNVPSTCSIYRDSSKFTLTESETGFSGTFKSV